MDEYKESCYDKILWNEISQLHEATLQISRCCFGYKKLCTSFIIAGCAFIVKSIEQPCLYYSLAAFIALTSIGFWICDATAYYYQKKTRGLIQDKLSQIAKYNNAVRDEPKDDPCSWPDAFFNKSMSLYIVFITMDLVLCIIFFITKWIK